MSDQRPKLSRSQLAELRARGNLRPALHVVAVSATIVAVLALFAWAPHPLIFIPCCLVIGALQHHLSIIQHEAVHFLLFTNRRANNLVGTAAAHLIFFTMEYRSIHLKHHRSLGHDDDPDLHNYVNYPNDRGYVIRDAVRHLSGLAAVQQFVHQTMRAVHDRRDAPARSRTVFRRLTPGLAGIAVTQAALLGVFLWLGRWEHYVLLWILPLLTVAKSLTHFRNVVEHAQVRDLGDPEFSRLRTILCSPLEAFFFAPMNFNYHAEHHFYMGIPYHQLPRCHALLAAQPVYTDVVEIERGYLRFLFGTLCRARSSGTAGRATGLASTLAERTS